MINNVSKRNGEYYISIDDIDYIYYGTIHTIDTDEYFNEIGAIFYRKKDKNKVSPIPGSEVLLEKMGNVKVFFLDDEDFYKLPFEFKFIDKTPIPIKEGTVYQKIDNYEQES